MQKSTSLVDVAFNKLKDKMMLQRTVYYTWFCMCVRVFLWAIDRKFMFIHNIFSCFIASFCMFKKIKTATATCFRKFQLKM